MYNFLRDGRRAPHGARGLKQPEKVKQAVTDASRPAWGAWIETVYGECYACKKKSRPAWGAWIETSSARQGMLEDRVAPRMGRVD